MCNTFWAHDIISRWLMSLQSSAAGCGLNFCPKGNSDIILHSRRGETMKTTSRAVAVLSVLLSWGMWCTESLTTANNINVLSGPRTSSRGDAWFPVQVNTVGGCRRGKESGHCMKLLMIRLRVMTSAERQAAAAADDDEFIEYFLGFFLGIKYEDKIHQNQINKYLISPTQTELQIDTNLHQRELSSECSNVSWSTCTKWRFFSLTSKTSHEAWEVSWSYVIPM